MVYSTNLFESFFKRTFCCHFHWFPWLCSFQICPTSSILPGGGWHSNILMYTGINQKMCKNGLFGSRMCCVHFTLRGLKTLIFKEKGHFRGSNLMWNSTISLFRGVSLKKAKPHLGGIFETYVSARIHQYFPSEHIALKEHWHLAFLKLRGM